ncbi:hypothetical protein BG004_000251, partial [Podila humilis]
MSTHSKAGIIEEWLRWMLDFSKSDVQVLRDVSGKRYNVDEEARTYLADSIVRNHKVNMLQEASEQVHHVTKELTMMVRNAPAPLCSSSMTNDVVGKLLPPNSLYPPHMESSSSVLASSSSLLASSSSLLASSSSSSSKSRKDQEITLDTTKYTNPENNLPLKDALVSLSGVWNMYCPYSNAVFKDEYKQALDACTVKELDIPDTKFAAIVAPLVEMAQCAAKTNAGVKAQPIISKIYELQSAPDSEPYCRSLDALKTIGEQGLVAARQSNLHLHRIFDIIAGSRKCDTILTVEDLEVANFELKKGSCTGIKDEIQLRRTIRAM